MRLRTPCFLMLLSCGALLCLPADAFARGGRFSGPAGAQPPAESSPAVPDASDAGTPGHADGGCPMPGPGAPNPADVPNESGVPKDVVPGRKRPASRAKAPGLDDWIYWYEVNREEYEDLRRGAYVTQDNPLFALGGALGRRAGRAERRLDDAHRKALKAAVRDVLRAKADDHWVFTEGAAYVALGKIASTGEEIELITRALTKDAATPQYLRESAALGLGQLRRSDERRQLPATTLRTVRTVLTRVLQDRKEAVRTRAFAAISLGLLADQPTVAAHGGKASAQTLFDAWWSGGLSDEAQVGALMGLALHTPEDVPTLSRIVLQACVRRGKLKGRSWSALVRSQAALTLGRVGGKGDAALLAQHLRDRGASGPALMQATVIAAGAIGSRLPQARTDLIEAVLAARTAAKDPASRRLALMAVARMQAFEAAGAAEPAPAAARALRQAAAEGSPADRAFSALALSVAVRGIDEGVSNEAWQAQRGRALEVLRKGLAHRGLDGHARAAFATALGIARDRSSAKPLLAALEDVDADPDLRAHAALGLGLLGESRPDVLVALRAACEDARSDQLRMRTVTALGLLGGGSAKDRDRTITLLLEQLKKIRNQKVKGQIAITLARIGDARAVRPLIGVLDGKGEAHLNRAMACAALGLMGDEERTPVLSAARRDSHYLGGSSVVFELLDVL